MNIFKKLVALGALGCAGVSAQSLYNIAPNDDEATDSLPLTWTVGVNVGYDDNALPLSLGGEDGSGFISAFVQASIASVTPQTTWDLYARIGGRHYFDSLELAESNETNGEVRVGANLTYRASERLRFSSRNFVAYETEPDFDFGIAADRRVGNYLRWSSQNSVGYRWTERLGTQTGVDFNGVVYDDIDDSDFARFQFRHDFRYRVSPQTVVTAGYRFATTQNDVGGDPESHFLVAGIEQQISPVSAVVLRGGWQLVDGADSNSNFFAEAALRSQLTQQLSLNAFLRYGNEEFNRFIQDLGGTYIFDSNDTLRIGARASYAVNPQLSLFGGLNFISTTFDDRIGGTSPLDGDESEDLFNVNAGFSYEFVNNIYLTGSYNFSNNNSDFEGRDFDRNRVQLGVQATF